MHVFSALAQKPRLLCAGPGPSVHCRDLHTVFFSNKRGREMEEPSLGHSFLRMWSTRVWWGCCMVLWLWLCGCCRVVVVVVVVVVFGARAGAGFLLLLLLLSCFMLLMLLLLLWLSSSRRWL